MPVIKTMLCGFALALCFTGSCWSAINVTYVKPEQFFDMSAVERDQILGELKQHFVSLDKYLPTEQTLSIEITSVELSGIAKPRFRSGQEIRVLKGGADWPSMHLNYKLESNGQIIRSGEEDLQNMMYLNRMNQYPSTDNLRYEKQMIDDWFQNWLKSPQK